MIYRAFWACLLFLGLTGMAAGEVPTSSAQAGRETALRACSGCHLVGDSDPKQAPEGVPTFRSLARNQAITEARLRGFLHAPHPPMPDLALTRREIDDLVSYILSLR
jgi:cytochrome c